MSAAATEASRRQFVMFLVTGGFAAVVNYGSRFVFDIWTSYGMAIVLAYLCGMITAYLLARAFVFTESTRSTAHSATWFVLINVLAVAQTWIVSIALADHLFPAISWDWQRHAVAHAVGVMVPVFTSFVGHKYVTFR